MNRLATNWNRKRVLAWIRAGVLALALGIALAGCAPVGGGASSAGDAGDTSSAGVSGDTGGTSSVGGTSSAGGEPLASSTIDSVAESGEAPAPDAEIADVTTVAYLGPEGTYTEEAARLFFGNNDEFMPQKTVADALALVADGTAAYAVVPQENTLGGPVTDYIDALLATEDVFVVGEVVLPIRQTLMGLSDTDLGAVAKVVSHKQGLVQSAAWLDEHLPNAERVEAASTAAAAQQVAQDADPTAVAIAAPRAADLYGLEVLQENVAQSDANKTRFYVVSKSANAREGYGNAVFVANISAGDLPEVLAEACVGGTELVCVHDRPEGSALGSYRYVVELSCSGGFSKDELARLQGIEQLEYLGSYARVDG